MQQTGYYEIIRHTAGNAGLPFRVILGNVQFNRLHWHDSLEILCCIHGSFHIKINGRKAVLQEGDLITVGGGIAHEISEGTPDGLQLIFSVEPSLLRLALTEEYALSTVGAAALSTDHTDIQAVRTSIARLACLLYLPDPNRTASKEPPVWNGFFSDETWYGLHMELYHILLCLSRHKQQATSSTRLGKTYDHFIQCVELLHQNYDKPISAVSLATRLGFSEPTVYRLFKRHMGVSFNKYLNSVRISAACCLIAQSDQTMTEIASQCGYNSLSNFYRAFHQLVGLSPKEYQQTQGFPPRNPEDFSGVSMQDQLLRLNRFQPFGELPYSFEELLALAAFS